jgi:CRP-like cAMP-binding protein
MVMDAPTIESRVQVYLSELANESGNSDEVVVPFDRERMAEYLGVARPSLSRALGNLRDRGLLDWRKNVFTIRF